ncbi:MAG: CDP-alcohol phosphatidyltransferase family protein [Aristaeellaceae bacterium]
MANIVTLCRILLSVVLLFPPALSPGFFMLYLAAGLTDMLDGPIARKTHTATAFGARLDTLADMALVAACMIRLLPVLALPAWLGMWVGVIAAIKVVNLLSSWVLYRQLAARHTLLNRLTGFALFLLPLTLTLIDLTCSGSIVCALATVAAIQEGHLIRTVAPPMARP